MKQLQLFFFVGIALFIASCEPVELNELEDFELSIEQESDTIIQLSWTKANLSNFKKYVIIRSEEPITSVERPGNGFILAEINDFDENSFTDVVTKLSSDYYYRVYLELDERYLNSNQEHIHFEDTYPLTINYFIQAPQIQFTWSPSGVSSFQKYIIAFSDMPIGNSLVEILDLDHITINGAILNTATYQPNDIFNLHYKFLLDLGDRVISTESLTTTIPNSFIINDIFEIIEHNKHNNKLYFQKTASSGTIEVFDYRQEMMVQSINPPSSDIVFSVDRNEQQDELHIVDNKYNNNRKVFIYNVDNLTLSHDFNLVNQSARVDDLKVVGNWVFVAQLDGVRTFSAYDRVSGNIAYYNSFSSINFERKLEILDRENLEIIELSKYAVHVYSLDSAANLTGHKTASHSFAPLTETIAISPDKQYFAGLEDGLIYTSSLTNAFYLQTGLTYSAFAFSENSDKIYAASGKKVYVYDLATQTLESQINKEFLISYMFVDEGQLILVGQDKVANPTYTIINRVDL